MRIRWLTGVLAAALLAVTGPAAAAGTGPVARPAPPPAAPDPVTEVVGGWGAQPGRYPWVVRLSVGCGGSLIAPRYVLTAAHCVPGSGRTRSITVLAGSADLDSDRVIRVRSTSVRRAWGFRTAVRGDDWAVVRLERELDLPTIHLVADDRYDRGTFTVLGWGAVHEGGSSQRRLRAAAVPFVDDEDCEDSYEPMGFRVIEAKMICAGNLRRGGVDSCQGDSGGPLVRQDDGGRLVQVGIVSWGRGCGRPRFPGVYTQLSRYADSIADAADLPS